MRRRKRTFKKLVCESDLENWRKRFKSSREDIKQQELKRKQRIVEKVVKMRINKLECADFKNLPHHLFDLIFSFATDAGRPLETCGTCGLKIPVVDETWEGWYCDFCGEAIVKAFDDVSEKELMQSAKQARDKRIKKMLRRSSC